MQTHSCFRAAAAVVAINLACAGLPALAQTAPQTVPPTVPPHPVRSPAETAVMKNMSQNVDTHIASLHRQLRITAAEETQWASFAQVMRDNASAMDAAFAQRGAGISTMNAVQDMQSYAQIAQIQSANMQKLAAAFETLYSGFPPAQQKLADGVFRPQPRK